jgi:hypothetical protein
MKNELTYLFENINNWLKYAEAKNAGLSAFNVAILIGISQLKADKEIALGLALFFTILSIGFNLYSIIPVLDKYFKFYSKKSKEEFENNKDKINMFFFADIANLSSKQLVELIEYKTNTTSDSKNKSHTDIANQIIVNSEITLQKFKLFNISGYLSICALTCLLINLIEVST